MIRQTIITTQEDVSEIKETQNKMDEKIDRIEQKLYSL